MPLHPILVCDLAVSSSRSVHLTVSHRSTVDGDAWIWTCILHTGKVMANGRADTILAAQVAAQHAHELWLHRNRKFFSVPSNPSYKWVEIKSRSALCGRVHYESNITVNRAIPGSSVIS